MKNKISLFFNGLLALCLFIIYTNAVAQSIPDVQVTALPKEARETLQLIKQRGPFPHVKDGKIFNNREKRLPKREKGYYREYTVKTPGARNRGARRIVAGQLGEYYYTADHYKSFKRIRE